MAGLPGEWHPVEQHPSPRHTHSQEEDKDRTEDDLEGQGSDFSQQDESCPWYHQPKFARYWQHYTAMQSWMKSYTMMQKFSHYPFMGTYPPMMMNPYGMPPFMLPTSYSPQWNPYSPPKAPSPHGTASPHFQSNSPYNHFNVHQARTPYSDVERQEYSDDEESDDESMEIELSQEMIDFFKASQKFREERDKAKAEAEKKAKASKKAAKNPLNAGDRINCRAPVERPDEGRRKEMKLLYGKNSARIHSKETAMQMEFDRNCDRFRPAYWPIVALKL